MREKEEKKEGENFVGPLLYRFFPHLPYSNPDIPNSELWTLPFHISMMQVI
jgi:hypothetical protein